MSAPTCPAWCEGHPKLEDRVIHTAKTQAAFVDLTLEQIPGQPPTIYLSDDEVISGIDADHAVRLATALLAAVHEVGGPR